MCAGAIGRRCKYEYLLQKRVRGGDCGGAKAYLYEYELQGQIDGAANTKANASKGFELQGQIDGAANMNT